MLPAQEEEDTQPLVLEERVVVAPDPHRLGDKGCPFCHVKDEVERGTLLTADIDALCNKCHEKKEDHVIDPFPFNRVDLVEMLNERVGPFVDRGMTCITCHDEHAETKNKSYLHDGVHQFYMEVKNIDPHWKRNYCFACHRVDPRESPKDFKFGGDIIKVCNNCHIYISNEQYIHAVGMVPTKKVRARMPADFALSPEGKISCITCHELKYQCLESEFHRKEADPMFFRGGPYPSRTGLCYKCHPKEEYQRLNPHDQINDEGELVADVCLYCHFEMPDPLADRGITSVKFVVDDLKDLCQRCHRDRPHPGGGWINIDHLAKPSKRVRQWIRHSERTRNVVLPLEPDTEKIFCCTCHNPHERGVLRGKYDRGADDDRRLRLGAGFELCGSCHVDKTAP